MESNENTQSNEFLVDEIKARLASMERRLGGLVTRLRTTTIEEFLTSEILEEFTFARLYRASKDVIYLAGLLLTAEGVPHPEHETERLTVLVNKEIIPADVAAEIQRVLNFFETHAHTHGEVDQNYLWQLANNQTNGMIEFGRTVHTYIE
jgi:uncharacterized protein YutE (UPF0331/DUF86 family)